MCSLCQLGLAQSQMTLLSIVLMFECFFLCIIIKAAQESLILSGGNYGKK